MKRKLRFVTPRVTQSVEVSMESMLLAGSTRSDQLVISAGIGVENYAPDTDADASYFDYE